MAMMQFLKSRNYLLILFLGCLSAIFINASETGTCANPDCEGVLVITEEELKTKDGRNDGDIWLSVLGEVYDVTEGRKFYGEGTSYGFFAAKDASACFASGKFNEEGLKQPLDDLSSSQLEAVEQWRKFYADKDNYHFVGVLQGAFYDSAGKPTKELKGIRSKLASKTK